MTYFSVIDFNLRQTSDFCQEFAYAHRETSICSVDGTPVTAYISPVRSQISQSISNTQVFASRSVSQYGLRTTNLPRESARHRNLFACSPDQALSPRHSWQHRTQHTCRCQRISRLQNLCRLRHDLDPNGSQTLRQRPLFCGVGADGLCARHNHHRSVLERIPLGAVSQSQSCRQDAYAPRFARQYSHLYSYQRRQDARSQCTRHPDTRSWQFLHHGSRFYRLCSQALTAPSTGLLRHSWQIQSAVSPHLFTSRGQSHGITLRPNRYPSGTEGQKGLSATPATYQVPRYRKQQRSGLYYQQLRFTCIDHRRALPLSLAGRAVLQVDQTASSYQTLLRHLRVRSKNTDMDCHLRIRPSRYREEKTQNRGFTLHNITDTESDSFRKNTTRSTT